VNAFDMDKFLKFYERINSTNNKYDSGELDSLKDESGANGYWDLAGEFAAGNDEIQDGFYMLFKDYFLHGRITSDDFFKKYADLVGEALQKEMDKGRVAVTVSEEKSTIEVWELVDEEGFFKGAVKCDLFSQELNIEDSELIKKFTFYDELPVGMRTRFKYSLNPKILKN